jgi:hypothetical protein
VVSSIKSLGDDVGTGSISFNVIKKKFVSVASEIMVEKMNDLSLIRAFHRGS